MKRKVLAITVILAAILVVGPGYVSYIRARGNEDVQSASIKVKQDHEGEFAGMAKIGLQQAIDTALTRANGKLLRAELGNENGFLIYDIEIVEADQSVADVKVDAGEGNVLLVSKDSADRSGDENIENDSREGEVQNHGGDDENQEGDDDRGENSDGVKSGSIQVKADHEWEYTGMATISYQQAIKAALNQVTGKVIKVELESENGFLVYGVEVVDSHNSITDVKVDAGNGQVLISSEDQADGHQGMDSEDRDGENDD